MALCSVADVKALVSPQTVTDSEIGDIIDHSSMFISLETGASTDASDNKLLRTAAIHSATAYVLQRMKYTGELAQKTDYGNESLTNNIDDEIKFHQQTAAKLTKKYNSLFVVKPRIIYSRVGIRTINSEAIRD